MKTICKLGNVTQSPTCIAGTAPYRHVSSFTKIYFIFMLRILHFLSTLANNFFAFLKFVVPFEMKPGKVDDTHLACDANNHFR